jgi:hypothetical protein
VNFIFRDVEKLALDCLSQGDVIEKTPEVVDRVSQAHQYYANAVDYTHFMVITQSCDLIRRRGEFKAPYITVAAVKPLRIAINHYFETTAKPIEHSNFTYQPMSAQDKAKQLLERHLNNTESDYFFLPRSGHPGLKEDLLVFLRLTIALRKEHYDVLSSAKIAELSDVFQAKLGWLKGNIYSRVATPDLSDQGLDSDAIKKDFYKEHIPLTSSIWLSSLQVAQLRSKVKNHASVLGRDLTSDEVLKLIEENADDDVRIIADNIVERLKKNGLIPKDDPDLHKRFSNVISNESTLKSLIAQRK